MAWGPACDELVRRWTPLAERWADRMERHRPGLDWWGVAGPALWRAAETFDAGRGVKFSTWLLANLRGGASSWIRTYRRRVAKMGRVERGEETLRMFADPGDDPDDGPIPWLDALSPRQAEVVGLVAIGGHTLSEAARLLGVRHSTADFHYRRGLEKLRAMMTTT